MRTLFTFLLGLFFVQANAQWYMYESFEAPYNQYTNRFIIDTSYHNNIWQIGKPAKAVFTSAISQPNAIVTDTLNPYPPNDTSVFTAYSILQTFQPYMYAISFYYRLDIDSGDIARMEISGDSGVHWMDVIKDDTAYDFQWISTKPRFDTSTSSTGYFYADISDWLMGSLGMPGFGPYPHNITSDTILYRFTFISDSVNTNKDGWLIDNFRAEIPIHVASIDPQAAGERFSFYPNPSNGKICLMLNDPNAAVYVYDIQGRCAYKSTASTGKNYLDLNLPDGVYMLRCTTDHTDAYRKIIIRTGD